MLREKKGAGAVAYRDVPETLALVLHFVYGAVENYINSRWPMVFKFRKSRLKTLAEPFVHRTPVMINIFKIENPI